MIAKLNLPTPIPMPLLAVVVATATASMHAAAGRQWQVAKAWGGPARSYGRKRGVVARATAACMWWCSAGKGHDRDRPSKLAWLLAEHNNN